MEKYNKNIIRNLELLSKSLKSRGIYSSASAISSLSKEYELAGEKLESTEEPPEELSEVDNKKTKCFKVYRGKCQDDSLPCEGEYRSGYCPGEANIRCCIPKELINEIKEEPEKAQKPVSGGRWASAFGDEAARRVAHNGQDISATLETPVKPLASGVVTAVRSAEEFISKSKAALSSSTDPNKELLSFINGDMRLVDYKNPKIQGSGGPCPVKAYRWVQKIFESGGFSRWKEGGAWVIIEHPWLKMKSDGSPIDYDGVISAQYAHLHDVNVGVGDIVTRDTIIGTVGRTGVVCNQPHLHLEVFTGNNASGISGNASGQTINPRELV